MEARDHCTLLALRLVWFDSEAALSQAFSSQAFSRRTGGERADAPVQLALPGPIQTRSQLNWFPSPASLWVSVGAHLSPHCSSSLTQKDGDDADPYLRQCLSWFSFLLHSGAAQRCRREFLHCKQEPDRPRENGLTRYRQAPSGPLSCLQQQQMFREEE